MLSKLLERHIPVEITKMRVRDFLSRQQESQSRIFENVQRGHGWKSVSSCPVCGSDEYEHELEKHNIQLSRCVNCELRFHTKIPADPNDIYQDPSWAVNTKEDEEDFEYRRERFGRERIKLIEDHCGTVSDKVLLDVGCGNGYFLSAVKEVFKRCVGSELSEHLKELAEKKTGLLIYREELERFPERDFDIITAIDVIEHISTPVRFMKAARDLLKPGGHILLYTPNFDSFSIRVMREYSAIVGIGHVILFNHVSVAKLGQLSGLEMIHTETRGLDVHSIISYQEYLDEEPNVFLVQWLDELQTMIDGSGTGDYLRVIYRKPLTGNTGNECE